MLSKKLLLLGFLASAHFAFPALAQEAPETAEPEDVVEEPSDLDVTLTVVEDSEDVQDLINDLELPPEAHEIAQETWEAVKEVITAAENGDITTEEEAEVVVQEAMARSREMAANARLSANAASEEAMRSAEAAREAAEEAVKNALSEMDMNGDIEQMMQEILDNLPDDIRSQLPDNLDSMLEQAGSGLPENPES